jgi:hypothetical protein
MGPYLAAFAAAEIAIVVLITAVIFGGLGALVMWLVN